MTIHDFDMARYLIADEVVEVYAVGSVRVDPQIGEVGDIDTAVITLRFQNGVIATLDNSREAIYGYDQRVEVFGSKGMVTAANALTNTVTFSGSEGTHAASPPYFFVERYKPTYLAELRAFSRVHSGRHATPGYRGGWTRPRRDRIRSIEVTTRKSSCACCLRFNGF